MVKDQRIILLISLKLNGEATPEELMELEAFIKDDPELLERIENMKQVWKNLGGRSTGLAEESFEKHLHKLNNEVFAPDTLPRKNPEVQKLSPIRTLRYNK